MSFQTAAMQKGARTLSVLEIDTQTDDGENVPRRRASLIKESLALSRENKEALNGQIADDESNAEADDLENEDQVRAMKNSSSQVSSVSRFGFQFDQWKVKLLEKRQKAKNKETKMQMLLFMTKKQRRKRKIQCTNKIWAQTIDHQEEGLHRWLEKHDKPIPPSTIITPERRHFYRRIFDAIDVNGDQGLSMDELIDAFRYIGVTFERTHLQQEFKKWTTSEEVNFNQFAKWLHFRLTMHQRTGGALINADVLYRLVVFMPVYYRQKTIAEIDEVRERIEAEVARRLNTEK